MPKYLLLIYFVAYMLIAFVGRSFLIWRKTGINPYVMGKEDNAHDFIGKLFRILVIMVPLVVVINTFSTTTYAYFLPVTWLQHPLLVGVGWALLLVSLIWIATAQGQMGLSWRIGIDNQHQTELVQKGLFRLSRNPIFLGMRLNLLGLFLVLPNAVTLVILVLGDVLIQIQVRLEEAYLSQVHGEQYQSYCQQVRRWL